MKCQLKRNYCTERKDIAIPADQIQQNTKKEKKKRNGHCSSGELYDSYQNS